MPKIDKEVFKNRRIEIKENPKDFGYEEQKANNEKVGTQEWVAEKAAVDLKTIQNLESKGVASMDTINKVSNVLKINGLQYTYEVNADNVRVTINNCIDFRPATMPSKGDLYLQSNLMMTIDHLGIDFLKKRIDHITLEKVEASMELFKFSFIWWYFVSINEDTKTWLGIEEDVSELLIEKKGYFKKSIMLKQNDKYPTCWDDFVENINNSKENYAELKITLYFKYFKKELLLKIDINDIKTKFSFAMDKYNSKHPYRVQTTPILFS